MPVVPINNTYSNVPAFIDSLFVTEDRSRTVAHAITSGQITTQFAPEETPKIISVWTAAWRVENGLLRDDPKLKYCQESDRVFIRVLSRFLHANDLCLVVPQISLLNETPNTPPVYILRGYEQYPFVQNGEWDMNVVSRFLELLFCGAHFVFIQDESDLGVRGPSFYARFRANGELEKFRREDPGNSHYTSVTNTCGYYIPRIPSTLKVASNKTPKPCPFFLALLVGPTDSQLGCDPTTYSTFMQLEGWEAISDRHNFDFELYNRTLWNISTYGACAYSEKRATTVFLAPREWDATTNPDTIMAPYAGAKTRQRWLNTDVVKLA